MSKEMLCIIMLIVFFAVMIYVGFYSRKHATDVDGFVLGGRGVKVYWQGSRSVADGVCVRYVVLFSGYFRWLCGAVWMELRYVRYLGRTGQRLYWFFACVEYTWKKNSCYDAASGCEDYAGFFREEI